jgi:hypothetical protein
MNNNENQKPNTSEEHDKLFQVRPLLDEVLSNLKSVSQEEYQSVDEQMVPFKGRSKIKQYLKCKPHK